MDEKTVPLSQHSSSKKLLAEARRIELEKNLNYRALFDQTKECVFIIGLDLTYIAANQQALELLRYEEKELVGMPVSNVMSLDEQLTHDSLVEGPNLYERILKRKDGTTVPVEVSTSLVYQIGNEPAYIQSIARDISERKNAEEMLKKQARIL
ncbi:MAG: PAS domain S-box protein, partial [Anaerolineales bacterium]